MAKSYTKFEADWKHKAIENFTLKKQKLLSIAKDIYQRIKGSVQTYSSTYIPYESSKVHIVMIEQKKAEAIAFFVEKNLEIR